MYQSDLKKLHRVEEQLENARREYELAVGCGDEKTVRFKKALLNSYEKARQTIKAEVMALWQEINKGQEREKDRESSTKVEITQKTIPLSQLHTIMRGEVVEADVVSEKKT